MPNPLRHFSIGCENLERAQRFYEAVFGWRIEPWGPPGFLMIFPEFPDRTVTGDLHERREPLTAAAGRGFECTFGVKEIKPIADAIVANGGRIDAPEYRIEGVGNVLYFIDTEGNRVAAMKYDGAC
jgi:predicted enzyme related to lactoylglutathione lyase